MAEYTKGTGPQQLPQGGASTANAATPPPEQGPDMQQDLPQDIPVEYGPPQPVAEASMKESENLNLLTGPSDPSYSPGPQSSPRKVARNIIRNLPMMAVAAKDPEAPPALRALFRALVARAEAEQAQRGNR